MVSAKWESAVTVQNAYVRPKVRHFFKKKAHTVKTGTNCTYIKIQRVKCSVYFQNALFVKYSDLGLRLCSSCELFSARITKVHLNRKFIALSPQHKMIIKPLRENEIPQARAFVL